jgi:hypothetical protein
MMQQLGVAAGQSALTWHVTASPRPSQLGLQTVVLASHARLVWQQR